MILHRRKRMEPPRTPAWLVTYADLATLILAFFVLLISFSEVQRGKLEQALQSIQGAMGQGARSGEGPWEGTAPLPYDKVEQLARQLQEQLLRDGRDGDVRIEFDGEGGLVIELPNRILFDSGSADLRPDPVTHRVLGDVADLLSGVPGGFFETRGHTDDRPLAGPSAYRDNYELSFARAMAVTRYLSRAGRMPLERFEVIACGPGQPVATNDTPEGQAANRRVEIRVRGELTPRERTDVREKSRALFDWMTGKGD